MRETRPRSSAWSSFTSPITIAALSKYGRVNAETERRRQDRLDRAERQAPEVISHVRKKHPPQRKNHAHDHCHTGNLCCQPDEILIIPHCLPLFAANRLRSPLEGPRFATVWVNLIPRLLYEMRSNANAGSETE